MNDIHALIEQVAQEATTNTTGPGLIRGRRRAGAPVGGVLSVRLTADQLAFLAMKAETAGKPTSAYARDIILDALEAGPAD